MKRIRLPRTDLEVSVLCLGTGQIGVRQSESEARRLLSSFLDEGGNFVDTARVYSDWVPGERGRSERIIGQWLRDRGSRDSVVIATKGAHPELESMERHRSSPQDITWDLDHSLKTLGVERIDLYYLHRDAPELPVEERIELLESFVRAGKIRHYGCSNWTAERIAEANGYAAGQSYAGTAYQGFVADQPLWNAGSAAMKPPEDKTLIRFNEALAAYHKESGIAVVPYSSQANGFFSLYEKLDTGDLSEEELKRLRRNLELSPYRTEPNLNVYRVLESICRERGIDMAQAVLAYLLSHDFPVVPVIGPGSVAHLKESASAADVRLTPEELARIESAGEAGTLS